jgi:hypothetical protein
LGTAGFRAHRDYQDSVSLHSLAPCFAVVGFSYVSQAIIVAYDLIFRSCKQTNKQSFSPQVVQPKPESDHHWLDFIFI